MPRISKRSRVVVRHFTVFLSAFISKNKIKLYFHIYKFIQELKQIRIKYIKEQ